MNPYKLKSKSLTQYAEIMGLLARRVINFFNADTTRVAIARTKRNFAIGRFLKILVTKEDLLLSLILACRMNGFLERKDSDLTKRMSCKFFFILF